VYFTSVIALRFPQNTLSHSSLKRRQIQIEGYSYMLKSSHSKDLNAGTESK